MRSVLRSFPQADHRDSNMPEATESRSELVSPDSEAPLSHASPRQRARPSEPPPLDYTELDGGSGRDVFYRPDRYLRADLGLVRVTVEVVVEGEAHTCELFDVSQNGIAFEWTSERQLELSCEIDKIVVQFDDHEAYSGVAVVSSVRRIGSTTVVGASLVDTLMNIEDVLHLRDVKAWVAGTASDKLRADEAPWRVSGYDRFKSGVAELRLFLEDGKQQLTDLEASLPSHISQGDQGSPARQALIERVRHGFASDILALSSEIDAATREARGQDREALREFSHRHLHDLLMQSPWMHRARSKPLGYPGDYEVMNGLYGNHFAGATLFAKAVNLAITAMPAGDAVRMRKDLMKRELSRHLDLASPGRTLRILSIAAGPAQEVYELLQERTSLPGPVEIVLFEQDRRALTYAYARLSRIVNQRWRKQVKIVLLHDSIKRLLLGSTVFTESGEYDMVYASGLCDYLQRHTWVRLCKTLYGTVAPQGTLYVGNMAPDNPSRWVMEFHLEWNLVHRERGELLELARAAAPRAALRICEEQSGYNPFVALTRD
jgi:extracellular factor (EF) 3-hydroxypalmitic acid methyl ester biosynthesis protein